VADYAPLTVMVYSCPHGKEQEVLGVLNRYGLAGDDYVYAAPGQRIEKLTLGEVYGHYDARMGTELQVGQELEALGCAFEAHQDAKWEFDGMTYMHAPGIGTYRGACSQDGSVVVDAREVDLLVDRYVAGKESHIQRELNSLTGRRVREALRSLARQRMREALASDR
jgi:hypothetical protein